MINKLRLGQLMPEIHLNLIRYNLKRDVEGLARVAAFYWVCGDRTTASFFKEKYERLTGRRVNLKEVYEKWKEEKWLEKILREAEKKDYNFGYDTNTEAVAVDTESGKKAAAEFDFFV